MPSDFNRLRYILPKFKQRDYILLIKTLNNSLAFKSSDVAAFRLHVINHYYKYGLKSALDAFRVKKSTFYDWKKRYERLGRKVGLLVPRSTKPHHTRQMNTDWRLVNFIKVTRKTYGNLGKDKIKPFLDAYANELGIDSIGKTTIAKIIKKRNFTFESKNKLRRKRNFKYQRTNKSPKAKRPGYLELDSVLLYINQERHCFICVIDIFTKYAFAQKVDTLSSKNALTAIRLFLDKYPFTIHTVQTDNGSEFLGSFHQHLEERKISHKFIYPRCPRINGVVERFNRTIQEEFIQRSDEIYYDQGVFQTKLKEYLFWYNHKRPHASLDYQTPVAFIQSKVPKCG